MELVGLQVLIRKLPQGRLQIGSAEFRRYVHTGEARSRKEAHIGAKLLSRQLLGHPGKRVFHLAAVNRLRKNNNDRTPGLSVRIQTTPNLPDLRFNQLAHPGDLRWIAW